MVDVAAYKYTSDGGTIYQVVLPTDFAAVMGYVAATGAEPYLPASVAPRYATYNVPNPGLWRQVVVPTRTQFVAPPAVLNVGGYLYRLRSEVGEVVSLLPGGTVMLAAGPQGPTGLTGATATNTYYSNVMAADVALNNSASFFTLCSITGMVAGTYLVTATTQFQAVTSAGLFDSYLSNSADTVYYNCGSVNIVGGQWDQITHSAIIAVGAGAGLHLKAHSSVTNGFARKFNSDGNAGACQMNAVLIGP